MLKPPSANSGQPPPAFLMGADVAGEFLLEAVAHRGATEMLEKDVFCRDRHVGFEFEDEMAVGTLRLQQGGFGVLDRAVEPIGHR